MTGEHLTERDTEAIRLYVEERLTLKEVGARLGVSPSTAWDILQKAGVSRRRKGPRWGKLTQRHEEIARAYGEEGLTLEEVARHFGVSPSTVFYVLEKAGVSRRRPGRPSPVLARRKQEIIRAYLDDRLSLKQVAARFGLSPSTVLAILEKAGVSRRSQSWRSRWLWPDAEARSKEITHAYVQEGLSLQEVGTRFGLSLGTVSDILQRAGVGGRRRRGRDLAQRNQDMARLYLEERLALGEIGERFDLSQKWVRRILKGLGVSLRPRRGPPEPEHLRGRNDEIARLYAEGDLTLKEIGERFDLSKERVRQIAKRAGVASRLAISRAKVPAEYLRERNAEIIRLYGEGLKLTEIAARVRLSRWRVPEIVRKAGVPRRGRGRWRNSALVRRNEDIIRAYHQEELSLTKLGALFGLSPSTVSDILWEAGVRPRARHPSWWDPGQSEQEIMSGAGLVKLPPGDVRKRTLQITRLYVERRLSLREVGICVGLSRAMVRQVLERAGVPRRRGGPSGKCGRWQDLAQRNEEIVRMYLEEGVTLKQVAARFSLTPNWVSQILEKANVSRRRYPRELVQRNQDIIRAYLEDGLTRKEVARRFGISPSSVHHILGKAGVRRT